MSEPTHRSCPHCGAEVPALPECERCGIVFAKYRPRPHPVTNGKVVASRPESGRLTLWLVLLGAAIALAVMSGRRGDQPPADAIPTQPVARRPVLATAQEPSSAAGIMDREDDSSAEAESEPAPPTAQAAKPKPLVSIGYFWLENASGFDSGLEMAVAKKAPMAVYFQTDWCGYCREFESELLNRARVEEFTKYLVKVRINPESGPAERQIAKRYGVRGYPSFYVQAAAQASPRKLRQHKRIGGEWVLQSPQEFVTTLRRAIR